MAIPCAYSRSTRTLQSDDVEFVYENGREYGNDSYYMPCDQAENDRLAIHHRIYTHALKGKLTTTPITSDTRRILDLGTGPGHWAVAMARQYPHAEIVGIDMAVWDIETTEESVGCTGVNWEIDDLDVWGVEDDFDDLKRRLERYDMAHDYANREPLSATKAAKLKGQTSTSDSSQPHTPSDSAYESYVLEPEAQPGWHFSEPFDLIYMRGMKGVFAYWEGVYDEIYKNLNPGGWVEVVDFDMSLPNIEQGVDNFPFPTLAKLYLGVMQAAFKSGRPVGTFYMHPTYLDDAGFTSIKQTYVNVPIGQWPEDEEQRTIGKMHLVCIMEMLESMLLRYLTQWGDASKDHWTKEEVQSMIEVGKGEIMDWASGTDRFGNIREGWCASYKWIIGRKPLDASHRRGT
ncbi:hypothetical protein SLS60_003358 [Paraconiothyrium brasiliense]|uniref:S-adenosyl-L-methionine-dependent methyltransferase n=1 Tax=Paraconiothyrium brasiliense TaxID=300254 RepID=A0ABR3RVF6_9PLEO